MKVVPQVTSEREEGAKILVNSCIRDSDIMGTNVIESRVMGGVRKSRSAVSSYFEMI